MTRIVIADDHAIVREGLKRIVASEPGFEVAGEAGDGNEVLRLVREQAFDVLLLDLSMPDQGGIDALAAIKARVPELPVLILSGFPEAHYAMALLRQGAAGYLNKECDPEEIATAIRTVYRGRRYITPAVAELLAEGVAGGNGDKPLHETLSEREFQVFLRLSKGETIGHMADGMSLSVKTVSTHKSHILDKMGVANQVELVRYAIDHGLLDERPH